MAEKKKTEIEKQVKPQKSDKPQDKKVEPKSDKKVEKPAVKATTKKEEGKTPKKVESTPKKVVEKDKKPTPKKEQTPKKVEKDTIQKDEKKEEPADRVYHIAFRQKDHKWGVKAEGDEKAVKCFWTQEEAIEYAKKLAGNVEGRIVIHKEDGSFRKLKY